MLEDGIRSTRNSPSSTPNTIRLWTLNWNRISGGKYVSQYADVWSPHDLPLPHESTSSSIARGRVP
jgi:hypothetical protein